MGFSQWRNTNENYRNEQLTIYIKNTLLSSPLTMIQTDHPSIWTKGDSF
jgi:adenine specific DNA methylase Mod